METPKQFRRPLEWVDWGEPDLPPDLVLDNLRWLAAELIEDGDAVLANRPPDNRPGSSLRLAGGPFAGCRVEIPSPRCSVWVASLKTPEGSGFITFANVGQPRGRVPGSRLVGVYAVEDWSARELRWTDLRGKVRANARPRRLSPGPETLT